MAVKPKNFITTIVAVILWFFIKEAPEDCIEEPLIPQDIPKNQISLILLNKDNVKDLEHGDWLVFVEGFSLDECKIEDISNTRNVAFLCVDSFDTAEIAAKLQVKSAGDIIKISNGYVADCPIRKDVECYEILDYRVFFYLYKLRYKAKKYRTAGQLLSLVICALHRLIYSSLSLTID
jgi:hypothetical protein